MTLQTSGTELIFVVLILLYRFLNFLDLGSGSNNPLFSSNFGNFPSLIQSVIKTFPFLKMRDRIAREPAGMIRKERIFQVDGAEVRSVIMSISDVMVL